MKTYLRGKLDWAYDNGFVLLIALLLVLRVFFWFSPSHAEKINFIYIWPAVIAAVTLMLFTRRARLPQGMAFTLAITAWLLLSCLVNGDAYLEYNRTFMLGIVVCFAGCYMAIPTVQQARREQSFRLLAGVYVALMVFIAVLGVYAALTGTLITTPLSDATLGVRFDRLYVFAYHPNEIGSAFVVALFLLVYFGMAARPVLVKIGLALPVLVILVGIALTISRTSMLLAAAGLGVCGFWYAYRALGKRRLWVAWVAGGLVLAIVTVTAYVGLMQTIPLVASVTRKNVAMRQTADEPAQKAEHVVQISESRKTAADLGTFNMRTELWQAGFDYLKENPRTLIFGAPDNVVGRIPQGIGRSEYHLHNVLIEMLLLGGIPGLLLYACFLFTVFKSALRLAFGKDTCLAHRFLAVTPVLLMLNGITEIYPTFSGNVMDMMFFVLAGVVVALGSPATRRGAPLPAGG